MLPGGITAVPVFGGNDLTDHTTTSTESARDPRFADLDATSVIDARTVFAGLAPRSSAIEAETGAADAARRDERARFGRAMLGTVPIMLAGSVAISSTIVAPPPAVEDDRSTRPADRRNDLVSGFAAATAAAAQSDSATSEADIQSAAVPATYKVRSGDTVSGIAARYKLSTASVLALNGLSWSSLIFPGQVLKLTKAAAPKPTPSKPAPSKPDTTTKKVTYKVVKGDTVSRIASRYGVSTSSVLKANKLSWSSIIYPGQKLVIPTIVPASNTTKPTPAPKPDPKPEPAPEPEPTDDDSTDEPPVVSTPAPPVSSLYVIQAGDTVTKIAAKFGVSVQSILTANGLSWSSIIYTGRTLVIPGIDVSKAGAGITPMSAEMRANAEIIVEVGRELGVPDYGIVIALATAMQESSLRNIDFGDRDSLGLFQQRPSAGWGTPEQILDPHHAARLFYGGPSNPNKGKTRGLLDIAGWQSLTLTQAAQKVQISAYPNAYAKWEPSARAWFDQLT